MDIENSVASVAASSPTPSGITSDVKPRVWVLIGSRRGDNSQVLALAEDLGIPFETITLSYAQIMGYDVGRIRPEFLGETLLSLDKHAKAQISPPWPDLVIGVGRRSVPVARYIRKMSGGRTKLVRIGNPRLDPDLFDLVITTRQYHVPASGKILTLPVAMSRFRTTTMLEQSEKEWLEAWPRPHLLFAVGGETKDLEIPIDAGVATTRTIIARANAQGGSVFVVSSQRTAPQLVGAIKAVLGDSGEIVPHNGPPFSALLDDADEIFVTADSVSMLSEAILTGKPVGMVPVRLTEAGLRAVGARRGLLQLRSPKRDPRKFWDYLREYELVGTVEAPRASMTENPVVIAARAVRALLGTVA